MRNGESFKKTTYHMARMSIAERAQDIGMIRAGTSIRQVARLFNRRHFSIQSLYSTEVLKISDDSPKTE